MPFFRSHNEQQSQKSFYQLRLRRGQVVKRPADRAVEESRLSLRGSGCQPEGSGAGGWLGGKGKGADDEGRSCHCHSWKKHAPGAGRAERGRAGPGAAKTNGAADRPQGWAAQTGSWRRCTLPVDLGKSSEDTVLV